MDIFTDVEKRILEETNKRYKWIARDENGSLCIYNTKPYKNEEYGFFSTKFSGEYLFNRCVSDVLFKNVTWENSPIQYRGDKLLTPKERKYLSFVFKPFANDILYVQKRQSYNIEYIEAVTCKDGKISLISFPYFEKGTMYKGMKPEKSYTLKELGIVYNE